MNIRLLGGAFLNYLYNNIITHIPAHFLRKGFLRLFNRNISGSAVILMHVRILNFWRIKIGERVVINQYCLFDCRQHNIEIKEDTDIAPYVKVWTLGHAPDSPSHSLYGGDVIIGHHVWIASGVTILPGAYIGDGAVVAAGSVVHKPVEPKTIVGGNPARFIKMRNNDLQYQLSYKPYFE